MNKIKRILDELVDEVIDKAYKYSKNDNKSKFKQEVETNYMLLIDKLEELYYKRAEELCQEVFEDEEIV